MASRKVICGLLGTGLLLTFAPSISVAQQPAPAAPTAAELKKCFATLAAGTEGESEDFDNLVVTAGRRLVTYLKAHEVSKAQAQALGLDYAGAGATTYLKVFTYGYSSGGTRGTIHVPVLQWKNAAGKLFAYVMHEEMAFNAVYELKSPGQRLYLLLGQEEGDANTTSSEARAVEIKGDYLRLDAPVFVKSPDLPLSNVEMSFNDQQQTLRLDLTDHDASEADDKLLAQWGYKSKFPERPLTLFRRTYPPVEPRSKVAAKVLTLRFDGHHFVKN